MGNMIENVIKRIIASKCYPNQKMIYMVFSRKNRDELFRRARKICFEGSTEYRISYENNYIHIGDKEVYFIDNLNNIYLNKFTDIETFFYDETAFVRSRPFFYLVRPRLHYRYVKDATYKVE